MEQEHELIDELTDISCGISDMTKELSNIVTELKDLKYLLTKQQGR
jgi:hypothetical protein